MDFFEQLQPLDEEYLTQTNCRKSLNVQQMAIPYIAIIRLLAEVGKRGKGKGEKDDFLCFLALYSADS